MTNMWIGYEDTDRKISYPYAYNLSVSAQAIRVCAEEGDNDGYGVGTPYPGTAPSRYARLPVDLTVFKSGADQMKAVCPIARGLNPSMRSWAR